MLIRNFFKNILISLEHFPHTQSRLLLLKVFNNNERFKTKHVHRKLQILVLLCYFLQCSCCIETETESNQPDSVRGVQRIRQENPIVVPVIFLKSTGFYSTHLIERKIHTCQVVVQRMHQS